MKRQSYIKGAFIISAGGFLSKLLGAFYRIPLTAFLGAGGVGVYQMVYPLFCLLLTVASGGVPSGIARIISSNQCTFAERPAMRLYGTVGLAASLIMFALSPVLAAAQGEPAVELCCKLLSPSVFFVSVISLVRGYFQGNGNMLPTAASEVYEQIIKVACGVLLCYIFRGDPARGVAAAVFAVTISEGITAFIICAQYFRSGGSVVPLYYRAESYFGGILKYTVPLTFTAIAAPVSQLAESIIVVSVLRGRANDAAGLWGIFSGCATALVNLPVSLTYGLAAAGVPAIAPLAGSGDISAAKLKAARAMAITAAVSLPCAAALYALSPLVARVIFASLSPSQSAYLITLVRVMSVNAVTSSLVQTSSACLTALGKPLCGTLSQWLGAIARVALSAALVAFTNLSVAGAAISSDIAFLIALCVNLWYIVRVRGNKHEDNAHRIGNKARRFNAVD